MTNEYANTKEDQDKGLEHKVHTFTSEHFKGTKLNVSGLVNKNGIIAFHDCNNNVNGSGGVPQLIEYIKKKENIKFKKIVYSRVMGIAYYIV